MCSSDLWVTIHAEGGYADRDLLLSVAAALVDVPQAMPVQLHLAPAGYRLDFFKDDGRVVALSDEADPTLGLIVRLALPGEDDPIGQLYHLLSREAPRCLHHEHRPVRQQGL